jgi:hypothetical protein
LDADEEVGGRGAEGSAMQGCITSREVLRHPITICRLFGAGCYLRCLHAVVTRRRCTFLELVSQR